MRQQPLDRHLNETARIARRFVERLPIAASEAQAIVTAALYHDLGKRRVLWQHAFGNRSFPSTPPLAKFDHTRAPRDLMSYRHEFGSVLELANMPELAAFPLDIQDLILHLIAAHHGRARPHFPEEEAFDPERPEHHWLDLTTTTPKRFARLQRRFGRWGLSYLEALLRAADILSSESTQEMSK